MATTNIRKETRFGDAAVEGLLNGIIAGVVMAGFVLAVELLAGTTPQAVLGSFDVTQNASPISGLFMHLAVAGVYGVLFGLIAMAAMRVFGARMNRLWWLGLGALYGVLLLGIAQGIILPRTASAFRELPLWALASAHVLFGMTLSALMSRK